MARTQVKYGSAGLFVGPTPSTGSHSAGIEQLHRVQSISDTFDLPLEDVNQFGTTAAIDRVVNTSPTPTMEFTYFASNGHNEDALGIPTDGSTSIVSGFLAGTEDDKNYFNLFTRQGVDAAGTTVTSDDFVVGIGNGFISSYAVSAAVGGFMECSVSVEGSNYQVTAADGSPLVPAVNPSDGTPSTETYTMPVPSTGDSDMPTVIKKGDITFAGLQTDLLGVDLSKASVQSFSVSVDLPREALEKLGTDFVFSRPLQTPITATVSLDFAVTDLVTGSLANLFTSCQSTNFDFEIHANPCLGSDKSHTFAIIVKKAFFESENTSIDIGADRNGSVSFSVPIGAANDTDRGIFISGSHS